MANEICMQTRGSPWVEPYDLNGNGNIGSDDLSAWVKKTDKLTHNETDFYLAELQLSPDILCNMFKWDMIRMQFVHENASEEMRRQGPLSYSEKERLIPKVREDREIFKKRIDKAVDSFISQYSGDVDKGTKIVTFSFLLYANIITGTKAIIESLLNEKTTLAGVGMKFEKEEGSPALITELMPAAEAQISELILRGAWIMRIDGEDTKNMSHEETKNALRGPLGSTVELAVENENGEVQDISFKRNWLPSCFAY